MIGIFILYENEKNLVQKFVSDSFLSHKAYIFKELF